MVRLQKRLNFNYLFSLFFFFIPTIYFLLHLIKTEKIDLIHSNDSLDIYGPIAGSFAGVKSIQHMRLSAINPRVLKDAIGRFALRFNDKIITVSNAVAHEFFGTRTTSTKVEICYDWFDMESVGHASTGRDIRGELSIPHDVPLVGIVGRLEHLKGQHLFIEAAKIINTSFPETYFILVGGTVEGRGRDQFKDNLVKRVNELKLQDKTIFSGERSDIFDVISCFNIFVLCTVSIDSFPGVVLEAMACGKPVVGPNAGGVPEQIEDGETGLLYYPNNISQIADSVITLLKNRTNAVQMGLKGKRRVESLFKKDRIYPQIEKIYNQLLTQET